MISVFPGKGSRRAFSTIIPAGEIMISAMGNAEGEARSGFVLLDENFKVLNLHPSLCNVYANEALGVAYPFERIVWPLRCIKLLLKSPVWE